MFFIIFGVSIGALAGLLIQSRRADSDWRKLLFGSASGVAYGFVIASVVAMLWGNRPLDFEPSSQLISIESGQQFKTLVKDNSLVVVDFYADWCGPCKVLEPTIHELADLYVGRVKVLSVDIDQFPALAKSYNISSIPNVKLFRDGKLVHTWQGVQPKNEYTRLLDMLSE